MKKTVFKRLSILATTVMLLTLIFIAVSQVSVFAAAGYVFQENFSNTSNNGYVWGASNVDFYTALPTGYASINATKTGQLLRTSAGQFRSKDGRSAWRSFVNGANGDVTIMGDVVRTAVTSGDATIAVYNGTSNLVARLVIPASSTSGCTFQKTTVGVTQFTPAFNVTTGSFTFKIVLKWNAVSGLFDSVEYYPNNTTMAITPAGTTMNQATRNIINNFVLSSTVTLASGANVGFDNITIYVAAGVTLPTAEPTISGITMQGQTLTGITNYTGTSTELNSTYQWQESSNGTDYTDILDATSTTYLLTSAQLGNYVRYTVTPKDNAGNTGTAVSSTPVMVTSSATLATPSAPTVSGTTFSWTAVPYASSYTLVLSKEGTGVVNTYTGLTGLSQDCSDIITANGAGTYSATVQAIGDGTIYLDSAVSSSTALAQILATPSIPTVSDTTFSWSAVSNASSYTLVLSKTGTGEVNTYTGLTELSQDCSAIMTANGAGIYTATVQAIGDGTIYLDSAVSGSATTPYGVGGYVFQENFQSTSNNGYVWGSSINNIYANSSSTPLNGWTGGGNTVTRQSSTGRLRILVGGTSATTAYNTFTLGTGGDVTVTGLVSMADTRCVSVYLSNGTTIVARIYYDAVGTTPSYYDGATKRAFSSNASRDTGAVTFKIVLKWDGTKYASADYYIGSANIESNTKAGTEGGTYTVANASQTSVNRFYFGNSTTGTGSNLDLDDVKIYSAAAVTYPSATTPTISGILTGGNTLTASYTYVKGSFNENIALNTAMQWQESSDGITYTDIVGATSSTLLLTSEQTGKYIRYSVTPTDIAGNVGAVSLSDATTTVVKENISLTGNLIIEIPTKSGDIVSVNIDNASTATNGVVIMASFDASGNMNAIVTKALVINTGVNTYSVDVSKFAGYTGSTTKVFILDSITTLKPYCWNTDV